MKEKVISLLGIIALVSFCSVFSCNTKELSSPENPNQKKLLDGNRRFVEGKMSHPDQAAIRRTELAKSQNPFAVIVSCSDSRVPPEVLFDQGLGDLFVIRLAGNILNDAAIGSIEYAVDHLGAKYVMVLGHERCGAVEATVKGGEPHGHIGSLVKAIQPAVDKAKTQEGDLVDNAVNANVSMVVQQLKTSAPILEESVKKGSLVIVGARYDLDDGSVSILP
ncbi:carbonic anhydrase [Desulforegula conservatrix]|uniref:carbonic anhydrase n=1 Tax=Desulforegula conservatrix TaxID=153026 RepID=UPI0004276981|nr:carbonic anhydrase [Desulforegula conservatrix]